MIDKNNKQIPVRYDDSDIGEVVCFNPVTGEMKVKLDMTKDDSKLIKEMIMGQAPISMSCKMEAATDKGIYDGSEYR